MKIRIPVHKRLYRATAIWALLLCSALPAGAQYTEIHDSRIATVRMSAAEKTGGLPVLRYGQSDLLEVSFDDLSHEYRRFTYKVEHVDADFKPEGGLFESDYVQAVGEDEVITDYAQSMNTSVLYTHYSFTLPNAQVRPLLSGNYRLTVFGEDEEGDPTPVWHGFFYVAENAVGILAEGTTNTEVDRNDSHQQLSLEVNFNALAPRAAAEELKVIVLQNNRWDNAIRAPKPTGQTGTSLLWKHSRELIFKAGNEYRKFEMPSTRYPGMHIDRMQYYEPFYHARLVTDSPRKNYLFDEDQNGRFVPIADFGGDADTEADYVYVHFALETEEMPGTDLYVNGDWTYDRLTPDYRMAYNGLSGAYEISLLLKQGYYSYQYLAGPHGRRTGMTSAEGNFWQTENEYTILVYYRPAGSRYDRLVGWRTASYRPR